VNTLNPILAQTRQNDIARTTRKRGFVSVTTLVERFRSAHRPPQDAGGIIRAWQHGSQVPGS
jgi:hypothetical protein